VLPAVSSRTIDRAKHLLGYNEILNSRYPLHRQRNQKDEEKELAFIQNVYFNNTDVIPPTAHGATLTLHRNDPSSIVPKRLQRITDKEMYVIYVADWTAANMGKPRSKAYLIAHRYEPIFKSLSDLTVVVGHLRFDTALWRVAKSSITVLTVHD
jgi:hypothetical protein